jgi:hypothetical protein
VNVGEVSECSVVGSVRACGCVYVGVCVCVKYVCRWVGVGVQEIIEDAKGHS